MATTFYTAPVLSDAVRRAVTMFCARSRAHHIEYSGLLSSHRFHLVNVVAHALGDVDDDDDGDAASAVLVFDELARFDAFYTTKHPLEPPRRAAGKPVTAADWQQRLEVTRDSYPEYLAFFDREVAVLGVGGALRRYLPALLPGVTGAACHATISAGWAVDLGEAPLVAEGLAYMSVTHQTLGSHKDQSPPTAVWSSATGTPGPVARTLQFVTTAHAGEFHKIANDASLQPEYVALKRGYFQHRIIAFDDPAVLLGAALNAVGPLGTTALAADLAPTVEECVVVAVAAVLGSRADFFNLHAATSLYAVLAMIAHLDTDPAAQRDALAHWWRSAMAVLVAQDLAGHAEVASLLKQWSEDKERTVPDTKDKPWRAAMVTAFADGVQDEHLAKGVYVLSRWSGERSFSAATSRMCRAAGELLVCPRDDGGSLDKNMWFSAPPVDFKGFYHGKEKDAD